MHDEPMVTTFPLGDQLEDAHFSGRVWVSELAGFDQPCLIGHVTFEPGCRNNWHIHQGYQVLICTGGEGWCQFQGADATPMREGDVLFIPQGVVHWHGAAKGSWFAHLAMEPEWQYGPPEWLGPVTDADYASLA